MSYFAGIENATSLCVSWTRMASLASNIVAARQGGHLATAFHPELTGDDRFHRYFLVLMTI